MIGSITSGCEPKGERGQDQARPVVVHPQPEHQGGPLAAVGPQRRATP